MINYLVNYMIPARQPTRSSELTSLLHSVIKETYPEIAEELIEERSEDYEPLYKKLDALGEHILTSCYFVQYDGSAKDLLAHLLNGLPLELRLRIKLLVTEVQTNSAFHRRPK